MIKSVTEKNKEEFIFLIRLFSSVLNDTAPPKLDHKPDWRSIYNIANQHSLRTMLCYGVQRYKGRAFATNDMLRQLENDRRTAIMREANQQYEADALLQAFEQQGVKNMPLKGYWLKHDYPQVDMRSMSDIDILYEQSQAEQMDAVVRSLGFTKVKQAHTHCCYTKGQYLFLEMHNTLAEEKSSNTEFYDTVWSRCKPRGGYQHSYIMGREEFYVHLLEHLAHHFLSGGVGLRMVMDIYVYNRRHGGQLNKERLEDMLKKTGLQQFETYIKQLAYAWFSPEAKLETLDTVGEYVFLSNTFGRVDVSILKNAMQDAGAREQQQKKQSRLLYLLSRIFPGYKRMAAMYPILKRVPLLYPFSWGYWWFQRLFVKKTVFAKNIASHLNYTNPEDVAYYNSIMDSVGLNRK